MLKTLFMLVLVAAASSVAAQENDVSPGALQQEALQDIRSAQRIDQQKQKIKQQEAQDKSATETEAEADEPLGDESEDEA